MCRVKRLCGSLLNVYCCLLGLSLLNYQQEKKIISRRAEDFNFQVSFGGAQWHFARIVAVFKARIYIIGKKGQKKSAHRVNRGFFSHLFSQRVCSKVKHQQKVLDHPGTSLPWPLTPISPSHSHHMDGRCLVDAGAFDGVCSQLLELFGLLIFAGMKHLVYKNLTANGFRVTSSTSGCLQN